MGGDGVSVSRTDVHGRHRASERLRLISCIAGTVQSFHFEAFSLGCTCMRELHAVWKLTLSKLLLCVWMSECTAPLCTGCIQFRQFERSF